MKKGIFAALFIFFGTFVFGQVSADPSNEFYSQVERWETLGLIDIQPSLRPYSLALVEKILNTVIQSESETESALAKQIYEDTFNKPWGIMVNIQGNGEYKDYDADANVRAKYGFEGDIKPLDYLSAGYQLDFLTAVNPDNEILPVYRATPFYMADGYGTIKNYMEVDASLAATFDNFTFQTGINHNSFGPFYNDSVVLSGNAKHTANFALSYNGGMWNYSEAMFVLNATNGIDFGENKYPDKWLMMHSLDLNLTDWLSGTFYETVIFGNRFDPSYLIPMLYMVTQGVTGYDNDNLMMGGNVSLRPVKGLDITADFYLDDVGFTGLKEFHDIKLRCATQAGIKYIPQNVPFINILKLDYTMISPYMYSHTDYVKDMPGVSAPLSSPNYQIYTTSAYSLGSSLEPNSDRIRLSAAFKPVTGLSLNVCGTFIRHANVTEGLTTEEKLSYLASDSDYFSTDGTITQHPIYFEHGDKNECAYLPSAWNKMMLLTQDTKEYTVQADLDLTYDFPETKAGNFSVGLGYTFEYIHNYGVNNPMLPGKGWFYNEADEKYYTDATFTPGNEVDAEAELNAAYDAWKASLKDLMNHYLRINFKYTF